MIVCVYVLKHTWCHCIYAYCTHTNKDLKIHPYTQRQVYTLYVYTYIMYVEEYVYMYMYVCIQMYECAVTCIFMYLCLFV